MVMMFLMMFLAREGSSGGREVPDGATSPASIHVRIKVLVQMAVLCRWHHLGSSAEQSSRRYSCHGAKGFGRSRAGRLASPAMSCDTAIPGGWGARQFSARVANSSNAASVLCRFVGSVHGLCSSHQGPAQRAAAGDAQGFRQVHRLRATTTSGCGGVKESRTVEFAAVFVGQDKCVAGIRWCIIGACCFTPHREANEGSSSGTLPPQQRTKLYLN